MNSFPDNVLPSVVRVRDNKFTEADIRSILVDWRQNAGPILREVGDLIAHPQRDRGQILKHLINSYAKMAFFSQYKRSEPDFFPTNGTCDWWLKVYLLHQVDNFELREIKRKWKLSKKQLKRYIKGFFPAEDFPTRLIKPIDTKFIFTLQELSNRIYADPAYTLHSTRIELKRMMSYYGLGGEKYMENSILVAICVLLHNSKFIFPNKNVGVLTMRVGGSTKSDPEYGFINIVGMNEVPWKQSTISVMLSVLTTDIPILEYVEHWDDVPRNEIVGRLDFEKALAFDSRDKFRLKNVIY